MVYTLGQAAKATGKSKTTIKNALDKGRISGHKADDGSWSIDPAELHRVYPPVSYEQDSKQSSIEHLNVAVRHPNIETLLKLKEVETRLEEVQLRLQEKDNTIEDLRARLDSAERRITALLPQAAQKPTSSLSFWQWFTGRKTA